METQSLRTLKYGENDGAREKNASLSNRAKNIFKIFTLKSIAARLRIVRLKLQKISMPHHPIISGNQQQSTLLTLT